MPWWPSYDDAFITLTSAQAIWTGKVPGFPDAAPLHGITSPVHCALVAGLLLLTPSPIEALGWSQAIAAALYIAGLWQLGRPLPLWLRIAMLLVGLTAGTTWHQMSNGLETGLAMACATWVLVGLRDRARWLPLLLGLAPYVRPEFAVVTCCVVAATVWCERHASWRFVAWTAASVAPWALWLIVQVGRPFPSSLETKLWIEASRAPTNRDRLLMLLIAAGLFAWACGPTCAGLWTLRKHRYGRTLLAALGGIVMGYAMTQPSLLVAYHAQRYVYPVLPFAIAGVIGWLQGASPRMRVATIAVVLTYCLVRAPGNATLPIAWRAHMARELPAVASVLSALPPETVVAVGDAGYLAYATRFRLVDIVGLKTPFASRIHRDITAPSQGRALDVAMDEILRSTGASVLVVWQGWDASVGFTRRLTDRGWRVQDLRATAPRPLGQYRVVRLTAPGLRQHDGREPLRDPHHRAR